MITESFILRDGICKKHHFGKKHSYNLTFNSRIKGILKRYCNYKTFAFIFEGENSRLKAIEDIKREIKLKYSGNLELDF